MTTITIQIEDVAGGEINITGRVDPVEAVDMPPTGAMIIGSYMAANIAQIFKDAEAWYVAQVEAAKSPTIETPPIILSGDAS